MRNIYETYIIQRQNGFVQKWNLTKKSSQLQQPHQQYRKAKASAQKKEEQ